jgi:hypothetical protein
MQNICAVCMKLVVTRKQSRNDMWLPPLNMGCFPYLMSPCITALVFIYESQTEVTGRALSTKHLHYA